MNYISTRGNGGVTTAAGAIKKGLASDGGLYMPEKLPELKKGEIAELAKMSYPERAAAILSKFLTDYTYEELLDDCTEAYSEQRFPGGAAPVAALGEKMRILELWHGPTAAFKDMALQIMPRLFVRALKKTGEDKTALILVATSGDTGKAALEGYKDVDGVKIAVFYPVDGVSRVQMLQMATQEGGNVDVFAVKGNFDDAQNGVKKIFSDPEMIKTLNDNGYFFSSANSINWGRLAPQIVYYISAYCDLVAEEDIAEGDVVDVCVPTGNFGNIFAAYIAKQMGLPIGKLVCASNKNNILTDFLRTGVYDRNRVFHTTMSPSMDILISSNLERLLYLVAGSEETAKYMNELQTKGVYKVSDEVMAKIQKDFCGYYCDEENTSETIKNIYTSYNYLADTHSSVAISSAKQYLADEKNAAKRIIIASTASPYKFASSVYEALKAEKAPEGTAALDALSELTGVEVTAPLAGLDKKTVRFSRVIEKDDMPAVAIEIVKGK
ncbi:MAG: threonine synthase [Ruminococcaceae bacterium]|nr:threonine synthase [Oscillospiraceae bacterium]